MAQLAETILLRDSIHAVSSGAFRELYAYWEQARGADILPPVHAINPAELPRHCLPCIAVLGIEREPLRFHIRLSGTGVRDATRIEFTGKYVDEVPGFEGAETRFRWCLENALPYCWTGKSSWTPWPHSIYSVIALPFGEPDGRVERILVCAQFG